MKITGIKNSCLLINFGENKKVSDLLKDGKFSIGIGSKHTDINFDPFDAMRKVISIENDFPEQIRYNDFTFFKKYGVDEIYNN